MINVTGSFSDDMRKYVVKVPPLLATVAGVEITLPAVVFEFDTSSSTTPADVADALQEYVDKHNPVPSDRSACLCSWLRSNTDLDKGITSAFERALVVASGSYSVNSHVASVTGLDFSYKLNNELRLEWARHCITVLRSLSSLRNKEMNEKHNHKLLRPVKLKDLQVGDELILKDSSPVSKSSVTYKANKFVVLRFSDGSEGTRYAPRLEINYGLAPLCWVEGKPVYPGDGPLYYKDNPSWKHNEEGVFALSVRDDELHFHGGKAFPIDTTTWTKPQLKRVPSFQVEGVDVYPGDTVYYYGSQRGRWGVAMTVKNDGCVVDELSLTCLVGDYEMGVETFRLKPQLVIGDRLVPMPERDPLEEGEGYFTPSLYNNKAVGYNTWRDTTHDRMCLKAGLIHLTTEAAIAHGEALVALSKKKD